MSRAALLSVVAVAAAATLATVVPAQATAGSVHLTKIYYNSPGKDTRTNASLDAEYVVITNTTRAAVNLKGWVLSDASNHRYVFTAFSLAKGKSVTIHTGKGVNTATNRYWGSGNYIWNNDKDKATLKRAATTVAWCSYNNSRVAYTNC